MDHGPAGKWDPATLEIPNLVAAFDRWQVGLGAGGWNSLYWNNHDQPRMVSRFGDDEIFWRESATALATVLHLQRGTPYIYQGEELGMTNQRFASIADVQDIEALRYYAEATTVGRLDPEEAMDRVRRIGRDNARTPMDITVGGSQCSAVW